VLQARGRGRIVAALLTFGSPGPAIQRQNIAVHLAQFVENASSTVPWNQEIPLAPPRPRLAELLASPDAAPGDFVSGACEAAAGDFGPGTGSPCRYLQPLTAMTTVTAVAAINIDLDLMASPFTWAFARSSPLRSGPQALTDSRGVARRRARNGPLAHPCGARVATTARCMRRALLPSIPGTLAWRSPGFRPAVCTPRERAHFGFPRGP
jgi:hypothetical protein